MGIYAIAAFVMNGNPVGARLYNTDNGKLKDYKNSDIEFMMTQDYDFKNLSMYRGKLTWNSGVHTRYPQICSDGSLLNPSTVTVLGMTTGDNRKVKVINYEGKIVMASEQDLIAYGERNGISNCKISKREGTKFIQSISGNIEELKSELTMRMADEDVLEITLPEDGSVKELVIPDIVRGMPTSKFNYIRVSPKSEALKIKKVKLPTSLNYITYTTLSSFPQLETIVSDSDQLMIMDNALSGMGYLKEVYVKGISWINTQAFYNCPNLELVLTQLGCDTVGPEAFKGCTKFNIQRFLNCGVRVLNGRGVFAKNPVNILLIPDCCESITPSTFDGMPNLNKMKFDNPGLKIQDRYTISRNLKFKGDLYIKERSNIINDAIASGYSEADNFGFPEDVKIHLITLDDEGINTAKVVAKSAFVGLTNNKNLEYDKLKDVLIIFGTRSNKEIHDFIINGVNKLFRGRYYESNGILPLGPYKIKYIFNSYQLSKSTIVGEQGDAVFYGTKKNYIIIPTNRNFIRDCIKHELDKGLTGYNRDCFRIPSFEISNLGKIDDITVGSDGVMRVTFRNKKVTEIRPNS